MLQTLQIITTILSVVFQKDILFGIGDNKNDNDFIVPFNAISNTIMCSVIFFICYFILIKKDKSSTSIKKEVIAIILSMPIYYILKSILNNHIDSMYTYNFITEIYSTSKYGAIVYLETYISLFQNISIFCSFSILAIIAVISIGEKKKVFQIYKIINIIKLIKVKYGRRYY